MSTIFLQYFHNKSHYQFKKICDKLIKKQWEKNCDKLIMAMPLPKQGEKKWQSNCGNDIAEIGRKTKL